MNSEQLLKQILNEAKQSRNSLVVFDLDSTLFDVAPRTHKIIEEFFKLKQLKMLNLKKLPKLFHISDTIEALGLTEFKSELIPFWKQHFFSNQYLDQDYLEKGALKFIKSLIEHQIRVMYLTGRDQIRMKEGTLARLKKEGFLQTPSEELVMKPTKDMEDSKFKRDVIVSRETKHDTIWLFENEPENILLSKEAVPHVKAVFFESVHSGRKPEPDKLTPRIKSFCH